MKSVLTAENTNRRELDFARAKNRLANEKIITIALPVNLIMIELPKFILLSLPTKNAPAITKKLNTKPELTKTCGGIPKYAQGLAYCLEEELVRFDGGYQNSSSNQEGHFSHRQNHCGVVELENS
jgi:hypothetical protein